jgi:hypothetical protein
MQRWCSTVLPACRTSLAAAPRQQPVPVRAWVADAVLVRGGCGPAGLLHAALLLHSAASVAQAGLRLGGGVLCCCLLSSD